MNAKTLVRLGWLASAFAVATFGCASNPDNSMPTTVKSGCGSDNADDLIADFTTDNGDHPADGRSGGWYVYGDDNGAFDPPKNKDESVPYPIDKAIGNDMCSGSGSFHVKAAGFSMWGAAAATDLMPKVGAVKGAYDATKYKGISFWAKAAAPVSFVQVKFPDVNTDNMADPSKVDPTRSTCANTSQFPDFNCSPYLVKFGDADYPNYMQSKIDTTWKRFDVMFADTKQDKFNPGKDPFKMLDLAHLVGFAVQVNADYSMNSSMPSANNFELWIDDVRFIR